MRTFVLWLPLLVGCPDVTTPGKTTDDTAVEGLPDNDGDGYTTEEGDCDDADPGANPDGEEICDGRDNDCNGLVDDDAGGLTFYNDADGDGFGDPAAPLTACEQPLGSAANDGDCNDADADVNPGAEEWECDDPTDYNCDGVLTFPDEDGDGFDRCADCNDANDAVFPGAVELCNATDDDCDGTIDPETSADAATWWADADGDTYGDLLVTAVACEAPAGFVGIDTDCDDTDAAINPGAVELCDPADQDEDCDGLTGDADPDVDPASYLTWYADADADGYGDATSTTGTCSPPLGFVADDTDCNDADALYHPGAAETDCTDPNDYNCDGSTLYADNDADGYAACAECDDGEATVHPGATEWCNGVDDDCDGVTDPDSAADAATWYADTDGDSYGDAASTAPGCSAPSGYLADDTDCDDTRAETYPGAPEYCNSIDDDCDGTLDPDSSVDAPTWYADADGDTYGDLGATTRSCSEPAGFLADTTDCDDTDADVHPGADEYCNSIDDDCDGTVDPDTALDALTWYADTDGDAYGDITITTLACAEPPGFVALDTDCNDADPAVNPGAVELCDAANVDEDCDGLSDDDDPTVDTSTGTTWYDDDDGDGYGDPATAASTCDAPAGYLADGTDCDDTRSGVHPGGVEICEGLDDDEDCDGLADDDDPSVNTATYSSWYADADGDGYGDGAAVGACDVPAGYAAVDGDCDDLTAAVNPGAAEVCDEFSLDENCDGALDETCIDPCSDLVVVVYTDYTSWTATTCPSAAGAARSGASVTYTTNAATFRTYISTLAPDVAIVDIPSNYLSSDVATGVTNQITAGGYVLFSYWDLDNTTGATMRAALGVTTSDIYTPQAMASTSTATLWTINDTMPASMSSYSHNANDNGDILTATSSGTSETLAWYGGTTTNAAIIATNSGQTIVNGFLSYDWQTTDDDADGVRDMHELYSNEVIWITGCTP